MHYFPQCLEGHVLFPEHLVAEKLSLIRHFQSIPIQKLWFTWAVGKEEMRWLRSLWTFRN
uniref:Uncharacterized protein n=1 Tax=Arundo donax TaxID=35708 RepID=A0A0A9GTV3_ARUDO